MKKILLSMMAVAALASCSQDEQVNITTGENEIVAGATTLSVDASTKAPVNSIPAEGLLARVPVSSTPGDYTAEWQNNAGYMKFMRASEATSFCDDNGDVTPKFYPADNSIIYLCGLYPHDAWGTINTSATASIDGKTDLMFAPQVTTTKDDAPSSFKTLAFAHLLTQLRIQFQAADQDAANAWGNISGLELLDKDGAALNKKVTVTLSNGTPAFATGTGTLSFYQCTSKTDFTENEYAAKAPTTAATYVAYILCPPVIADGATTAEYKLKITSAGGATETVDINLKDTGNTNNFNDSTAGSAFDILLNFKATEIKAQATITRWQDKGQTEVPVGE